MTPLGRAACAAAALLLLAPGCGKEGPAPSPPATIEPAPPDLPKPAPQPRELPIDPAVPTSGPLPDRSAEAAKRAPWDNFKTHDPLSVNYLSAKPHKMMARYEEDFIGTLAKRGAVDFQLVHALYRKGFLSRDDRPAQVAKMVEWLQAHPEEPTYKANVAIFLMHVGFEAEALELVEGWRSEAWFESSWDANFYTGSLYFRMGDYARAVPFLERALALNPEAWTRLWLRLALDGVGDPATAARREELFAFGEHMGAADPEAFPFVDRSRAWGIGRWGLAGAVAFADYDGDALVDFVVNAVYGSPELYRFRPNKGFERVLEPGLEGISNVPSASVAADFDNDGDVDLFAASAAWFGAGPNRLLESEGGRRFVDVSDRGQVALSDHNSCGATALDFDQDGLLDLAVSGTRGGTLRLLKNKGGLVFEEVTEAAGITGENRHVAVSVASGDLNGDGWTDLFVNVFGPNRLFVAEGPARFREVAAERGVAEGTPNGFGTWMFDYDGDGDLDIAAANFANMGLQFLGGFGEFPAEHFSKPAQGTPTFKASAIYRNDGQARFEEVGAAEGLVPASVMGAQFIDMDLDGWLDIVLGPGSHPLPNMQPLFVYRNRGDAVAEGQPRFANTTPLTDPSFFGKFHGLAFADVDRDGDPDLYANNGGVMLADRWRDLFLENRTEGRHWLHLRLEGRTSNRSGVGSRVIVHAGERERVQEVSAGEGFGSTNSPYLIFGLGEAESVEEVEIQWLGGEVQRLGPLVADQALVVTEGSTELRRVY